MVRFRGFAMYMRTELVHTYIEKGQVSSYTGFWPFLKWEQPLQPHELERRRGVSRRAQFEHTYFGQIKRCA